MKYLISIILLVLCLSSQGQEPYQYKKGEITKVKFSVNNISQYRNLSIKGNRVKVGSKWMYFTGDSIVLYRNPCTTIVLTIIHGSFNGSRLGAACPYDFNYNYNDSTSCGLFLNRSQSREL